MHFPYGDLYDKYRLELLDLSRKLRRQFHVVEQRGFGTAFSDVEGEILYMLVRETRPTTVFEISPWHGWSTNYLLAGVTANEHGLLHSFELTTHVGDVPIEEVIRSNQHPEWDQRRLVVHVGDAREKTNEVDEDADFLLLDSCHDAWFADWYIESLFPRVRGTAFVQDIAFFDRLEPSGEAARLWEWLGERSISPDLIGSMELELEGTARREGLAERRYRQSNAVVFKLPEPQQGPLPHLARSIESRLGEVDSLLDAGEKSRADELLNDVVYELLRSPTRANRHRPLVAAARLYRTLGEDGEAARCLRRAHAIALGGDASDRTKALDELVRALLPSPHWRQGVRALVALASEPGGVRKSSRALARAFDPRTRRA